MIIIHNNSILIGDIIYYVIRYDGVYTIHKSRVAGRTIRRFSGFNSFFNHYVYHCEDGHQFETLNPSLPVFKTKEQAVEYVVKELQQDINGAEISLRNAQEHLEKLHRSLNVYQKIQLKNEKNTP